MNYTFTQEDIEFVERAIELKNKGFYIDSMQLTEHYNKILNKRVNNTTCGSCMRQRVSELETALNAYKAKMAQDSVSETKADNTKEDENKAVTDAGNNLKSKRKK